MEWATALCPNVFNGWYWSPVLVKCSRFFAWYCKIVWNRKTNISNLLPRLHIMTHFWQTRTEVLNKLDEVLHGLDNLGDGQVVQHLLTVSAYFSHLRRIKREEHIGCALQNNLSILQNFLIVSYVYLLARFLVILQLSDPVQPVKINCNGLYVKIN